MKNDRLLKTIFMIKALKNIFGDDLRTILIKGFGIDIKKVNRISYLYNEFLTLNNFYNSEVDNHRKISRKYCHYEKVVKKNGSIKVLTINNKVSINNWEGLVK